MLAELPGLNRSLPVAAIMEDCLRAPVHDQHVVSDVSLYSLLVSHIDSRLIIGDCQGPRQSRLSHQGSELVDQFYPRIIILKPLSQTEPFGGLLPQMSLGSPQSFFLLGRQAPEHLHYS